MRNIACYLIDLGVESTLHSLGVGLEIKPPVQFHEPGRHTFDPAQQTKGVGGGGGGEGNRRVEAVSATKREDKAKGQGREQDRERARAIETYI